MKIYFPREHGAWSMWITPFLLASFLSPWTYLKVISFIGIFCLYVSTAPLLTLFRRQRTQESPIPSLLLFISLGLLFLAYPLWRFPETMGYGLIIIPLFIANIYFARMKKERLFMNDILAIIALSSVSLYVVHIGFGFFHPVGLKIWFLSALYFIGTVFYVKSLIRERGNRLFRYTGFIYHFLMVFLPFLIGEWKISLLFLPFAIKMWLTPLNRITKPMTIGILEIVASIIFVLLGTILL